MAMTTVTWVKDLKFIATDSTQHSIVVSSPDDGVGMKPSELLLASLGSCSGYDVVDFLVKRRLHVVDMRVEVNAEQATEGWPRPYTAFHLHFVISGTDIPEKDVERAIKLSEEKYCSVWATLAAGATITWDYEIIAP